MSAAVIPEPIAQLQLRLNEIRSARHGKEAAGFVWQAAVELARDTACIASRVICAGLYGAEEPAGRSFPTRRKTRKPTFVELIAPASAMQESA